MHDQVKVHTYEELIATLEPVEESELQSDIRENAQCEMRRMRRNVTLLLSFLQHSMLPPDGPVRAVAEDVRYRCLVMNRMVSRALLFQVLPCLPRELLMQQMARIGASYRELAESTCRLCSFSSPTLADALVTALQGVE